MFITKNSKSKGECGEYNGYVAVPYENKNYAALKSELLHIKVHGGITFSSTPNGESFLLSQAEYLDDAHTVPCGYWIYRFDTCHEGDNKQNWSKVKVIEEVRKLSEQLSK